MPRKSNKTSYVMNLITNGEEEQGQEGQSGQELQNEQSAQAISNGQSVQAAQTSVSGVSPDAEIKKVVVVDEDQESERLSEEIRGQLEQQLEEELKEQAEAAGGMVGLQDQESQSPEVQREDLQSNMASIHTEPSVEQKSTETADAQTAAEAAASADIETIKTEIAEPIMDTEMNTATETMDMAANVTAAAEATEMSGDTTAAAETMETVADMTASADMTTAAETKETVADAAATGNTDTAAAAETSNTTTQPTQPSQSGYRMVNVMETLVARVDLDKYIKEYGVCPCPRCRADVHALILTSLPSKYVVMDENAISLMLNFYESRRKTDIFTATLKACLEVKEHPRHEGAEEK